jgi:hypothetical protein
MTAFVQGGSYFCNRCWLVLVGWYHYLPIRAVESMTFIAVGFVVQLFSFLVNFLHGLQKRREDKRKERERERQPEAERQN